jgi:hypothetical protein
MEKYYFFYKKKIPLLWNSIRGNLQNGKVPTKSSLLLKVL